MRQIILVTDGCSNVGVSPVLAASHARSEGITVNVIGVVDRGELGELGAAEIQEIAVAGGGMSRIVSSEDLSRTVQMMTRKTVVGTIQAEVGRQLQTILGTSRIEELPPEKRSQVVDVMEDMAESAALKIVLLIDASASMKPKLQAVKEAIRDLMLSLQARMGESKIAVFHFPSSKIGQSEEAEMDCNWTSDLANIDKMFYKLNMKGTTPTGPALFTVLRFMTGNETSLRQEATSLSTNKDGMLSDYIV